MQYVIRIKSTAMLAAVLCGMSIAGAQEAAHRRLDLTADLGALLAAAEVVSSTGAEEVMAFDAGAESRSGEAVADGIPDAAQLRVLQTILTSKGFDCTPYGGIGAHAVAKAWAVNLTRAAHDMPAATPAIHRAVSAYMLLDSDEFCALAEALALKATGVEIDEEHYSHPSTMLDALGDPDGDGLWNRLEWKYLLETSPDSSHTELAERFAKLATDHQAPDRTKVSIDLDLPDGDGANWNYDHLPKCQITFQSAEGLPMEARILDPPGKEAVPLPIGEPVVLPLGAEILVTLGPAAKADFFYTWDARGHMIDGSVEKTERFRTMRDGTVRPTSRQVMFYRPGQ